MTIAIVDVATDADLEIYVGGSAKLQGLLPSEWLADDELEGGTKTATIALQAALDSTLIALKSRRPVVLSSDLTDVSELKPSVCYGALEIIYRAGLEYENSPNAELAKVYGSKFRAELAALQPSTRLGATASSMSIRISRG